MNRAADAANDRACAVALTGLPMMGPGRLSALFARWAPAPRGAWSSATSRPTTPGWLPHVGASRDRVRVLWARAAGRAEPSALLAKAEEAGMRVFLLGEPGYPPELAADHEAPVVCFVLGDEAKIEAPARVAVIGTRSATAPGLEMARRLGCELAEAGVAVVSGLARGIDGAAHAGALRRGRGRTDRGRGQRARRAVSARTARCGRPSRTWASWYLRPHRARRHPRGASPLAIA